MGPSRSSAARAAFARTSAGCAWWIALTGGGALLFLAPFAAALLTHRAPDPLFTHYWWSPIASVPPDTIAIGSLGLALLAGTAIAAAVTRLSRRPISAIVVVGIAAVVVAGSVAGYLAVASSQAAASSTAIRSVLLRTTAGTSAASPQARRAIELALGWPTPTSAGIRVVEHTTAPAGPWLLQRTEILNQNLQDEGSDVEVESLVNPATGHIDAAWFYGL